MKGERISLKYLSDYAREKLIGKPVAFEVERDNPAGERVRITRTGLIRKVNANSIWIGPYCYLVGDIENLREA